MNKKPILVVMAAGMGSRYGGLKQIDPIGPNGELIIDFSLYDAKRAGFETAVCIIKHAIEDDFKALMERGAAKGMDIRYAYQELDDIPESIEVPEGREKPWGTSHAILAARDIIDGPFAVINADDYYGPEAFQIMYDYLCHTQDGEQYDYCMAAYRIENTLTELWSIFDFLLPGYLGSHKTFRQKYETGIVKDADSDKTANLRLHIAPFILRRLKRDVLTELPDKTESRLTNEMTPEQEKVYKASFAQSRKELAAELTARGFDASRIKILALLTRLRQIACDPAIFLDNYEGGSGKLDLLEEIASEATAGGHRMLIFSQFTTMLRRIRERLAAAKIESAQ